MPTQDELLKQNNAAPTDTTQAAPAASGADTYRTDAINGLYDAQRAAREAELKAAYDQNLSNAQAAADKIPSTYQQRANDLSVQYERNRRNLNQQAAMNGINTGAGSQQALALNSVWQRDYGNVQRAQADAQVEAQRSITDLRTGYENQVAQALAQNDYQRSAALLDEYNNQYKRDTEEADRLAGYGDFSKYGQLYGQDAANAAQAAWVAKNPVIAWYRGLISPEDYYKVTGQYPADYAAANSGGGGNGGYYGIGGYNNPKSDYETLNQQKQINAALNEAGLQGIREDGVWGEETNYAYEQILRNNPNFTFK